MTAFPFGLSHDICMFLQSIRLLPLKLCSSRLHTSGPICHQTICSYFSVIMVQFVLQPFSMQAQYIFNQLSWNCHIESSDLDSHPFKEKNNSQTLGFQSTLSCFDIVCQQFLKNVLVRELYIAFIKQSRLICRKQLHELLCHKWALTLGHICFQYLIVQVRASFCKRPRARARL